MKLLLTSGGVTNAAVRAALDGMLPRPLAECDALCIPTAVYAHPMAGPGAAYRFVSGTGPSPMTGLGWRSVGVLELTALPSLAREDWEPWVRAADVLLVDGGDAVFLAHWMRESGLADLLPTLEDTVWVGLSAGSMVLTPRIGEDFMHWTPPSGGDRTLGVVDFSLFPHLGVFASNSMEDAERWAAEVGVPAYALDDASAVSVVDGVVEVVSEGEWRHFPG